MAGRPAHEPLLYHPPPGSVEATAASTGRSNRWGPYHNAGDFTVHMAMALLIILCTLASVLASTAAVRFFLRRRRRSPPSSPAAAVSALADLEKQEGTGVRAAPAVVGFAAGAEAECAICLAEFAAGEWVRLMPACKHGFHVKCIDAWLASKSSCPICRSSCDVAACASPGKEQPSVSEWV